MSSKDIDEIYEELLRIYEVRYPYNPRHVLSYKISEFVKEGKTRENAILALYEEEGKITSGEVEVLEKDALEKKQALEEYIVKKKEELIVQEIKERKKSLEKLTLLFSKGELDEESYSAAIKLHEEKIARLKREKKEEELSKLKQESIETPIACMPQCLPEETYERKFSLTQRFYKLLTAPSTAMKDIALAPDYEGVLVVIALQIVLTVVSVTMAMQKIQFSGPHATTISSFVSSILAVAIFIGVFVLMAKWLVKSLLVKYGCDSGSKWDFKTAASVTGYAYLANIIISVIGVSVSWFLIPTFYLDTSDLSAAEQALTDYQAQLNWLKFLTTLPFSLFGLLWKSYLGGLGAHFGTKEKCSLGMGVAVFFVLSLIGFLISFI